MALRDTIRNLILRMSTQGTAQARREVGTLRSQVSELKNTWSSMSRIAGIAFGIATTSAAAIAVQRVTRSLVDAGRAMENYRTRLNAVIRDEERAARIYQMLVRESQRTPFNMEDLVEAATQLELLGINSEAMIRRIEDVAAVTGRSIGDVTQAIVQGVQGQTRTLMQLGITRTRLEQELGRGLRDVGGFENQRDLLEAIVRIMDRDFADGVERTRDRWDVMLSDMSTNLSTFKAKIAGGGFFDTIKTDFRELLDFQQRLFDEGAVDAFALGANRAFSLVHDVFVSPVIDDLDSIEIKAAVVAARTELVMLRAVEHITTGSERLRRSWSLMVFAAEAPQEVFKALLEGGAFDQLQEKWDRMIAGFEGGIDREIELEARIKDLEKALFRLAQTGGVVTPDIEAILGFGQDAFKRKDRVDTGASEDVGLQFGEGMRAGFLRGIDIASLGKEVRRGLQLTLGEDEERSPGVGLDTEDLEEKFAFGIDQWATYFAAVNLMDEAFARERAESAERTVQFALARTRVLFDRLGEYNAIFVRRGMNLGRAMNAFLVRSGAETIKALIDFKLREAKLEAQIAAARALIAIGSGNISGGLKILAGAAKMFALVGAGAIASAFVDARAAETEQNIIGGDAGGASDVTTSGPRGRFKGTASTVRVGPQVNNFYITITKTAGNDYVEGNKGGDIDDIQRLFDEGIIQIPRS